MPPEKSLASPAARNSSNHIAPMLPPSLPTIFSPRSPPSPAPIPAAPTKTTSPCSSSISSSRFCVFGGFRVCQINRNLRTAPVTQSPPRSGSASALSASPAPALPTLPASAIAWRSPGLSLSCSFYNCDRTVTYTSAGSRSLPRFVSILCEKQSALRRLRHHIPRLRRQPRSLQLHRHMPNRKFLLHQISNGTQHTLAFIQMHVGYPSMAGHRDRSAAQRPDVHIVHFHHAFHLQNRVRHFLDAHLFRAPFQQNVRRIPQNPYARPQHQ